MRLLVVLLVAVLTVTLTAALIARAGAASTTTQFRTPDAGAACRLERATLVCSSLGSPGSVALRAHGAPALASRLPWWDAGTPVLGSFHHAGISCHLAGAALQCSGAGAAIRVTRDGFSVRSGRPES